MAATRLAFVARSTRVAGAPNKRLLAIFYTKRRHAMSNDRRKTGGGRARRLSPCSSNDGGGGGLECGKMQKHTRSGSRRRYSVDRV